MSSSNCWCQDWQIKSRRAPIPLGSGSSGSGRLGRGFQVWSGRRRSVIDCALGHGADDQAMFFTRGSLTFKEAYERTGRALNVSVVPSDRHS
jgi:hypothetical protein